MRSYIWAVFLFVLLAGVFEVRMYNDEENLIGELWHDEAVWRIGLIPYGAVKADTNGREFNLLIIPQIENGFFQFHIQ